MKRRSQQPSAKHSARTDKGPKRASSTATLPPPNPHRAWSFRLAAAVLIPLLLLGLLELALRLAGYGYPTGFFVPRQYEGKHVLTVNPKFGWRFFDPGMARIPWPVMLPAEKPAGTTRIFVFGESAAYGDPQPEFGLSRMLEVILRERYPGRRFEVVNAAMTAINSHVILPIARDCAKRDGDIWIIYMGNNEVVGPFGSGTVFGSRAPNLSLVRAGLALKATRTGQLLQDTSLRWKRRSANRPEWGGMAMFLGNQVRQDDPRLAVTYAQFEQNLRDILAAGARRHVKMVVSTVASNLKDCAPFASLHRPGITESQSAEWNRLFESASAAGDPAQAAEFFRKAAGIDPTFADLQYLWGKACLRTGAAAEAREHFKLAREYDALRFRADSRINEIIRRVASTRQTEGILLCDAEDALSRRSPNGLTGNELLFEHVHPNFEGNYALALSLATQVDQLLSAAAGAKETRHEWPTAEACAHRLAFTEWNRYEALSAIMLRLNDPPFTTQRGHAEQVQALRGQMERSLAMGPDAPAGLTAEYKAALQSAPDDWVLHKNYGRLLQKLGDLPGAVREWERVVALLPYDAETRASLGLLLAGSGQPDRALTQFQNALRLSPDSLRALNGSGLALVALNRGTEAIPYYQKALQLNPASSETQLNLAAVLRALGKTDEARRHFRLSLEHKPNNAEALVELGRMCLGQGWLAEAVTNFNQALALEPTDATAHFCLGGALQLLRSAEAQAHFAEAVRLRPDYAEAHLGLGIELGGQGRHAEALQQFSEAVRLNPNLVEARLNFGIALVKQGRVNDAAAQFQEVLRLKPENPVALGYLRQMQTNR